MFVFCPFICQSVTVRRMCCDKKGQHTANILNCDMIRKVNVIEDSFW